MIDLFNKFVLKKLHPDNYNFFIYSGVYEGSIRQFTGKECPIFGKLINKLEHDLYFGIHNVKID